MRQQSIYISPASTEIPPALRDDGAAFEKCHHILPFDFSGFALKSNHVAANFN
jgi:hypothetical protein